MDLQKEFRNVFSDYVQARVGFEMYHSRIKIGCHPSVYYAAINKGQKALRLSGYLSCSMFEDRIKKQIAEEREWMLKMVSRLLGIKR